MDLIKVLVVDDSAFMRRVIVDILQSADGLEVVGYARNGREAIEKIADLNPDVLTLDLEMPVMDGLHFLKETIPKNPVPVVVVSALAEKGAQATLEALEHGAVDFVLKPSGSRSPSLKQVASDLIEKVRRAAGINPERLLKRRETVEPKPTHTPVSKHWVVVIGASTGGPKSLHTIFSLLPKLAVSILIVQHMPPGFTASLAERLNRAGEMKVCEAKEGMLLKPGEALVAPGDRHLTVRRQDQNLFVRLTKDAPQNRHRPSVDVTMGSVAELVGNRTLGVLLTGMGSDGAQGITQIHEHGGSTIAEAQSTAVIYGMPREAVATGNVDRQLPLEKIPSVLVSWTRS